MENLSITWETILILFGGIGVIGGGIGYIKKLSAPLVDLKDRINKHEQRLENDDKRLKDIEKATRIQNKVLLALVSHEINGNSIDKLKNAKSELEEYLIER